MPDNRIRRIRPSDVDRAVELVHELALYEKAPDECHLTTEQLNTALFGPSPALFGHVAELDGDVVGVGIRIHRDVIPPARASNFDFRQDMVAFGSEKRGNHKTRGQYFLCHNLTPS